MLKPLLLLSALIFSAPQQPDAPAAVPMPADAATLVNPVKPTPESQAKAKKMYGYDCAVCHGAAGNGKGEMTSGLKVKPKDWTDPASLKAVSDGELFYIIKNGKSEMPAEGDRQKTQELWNMVILVRSFAKN